AGDDPEGQRAAVHVGGADRAADGHVLVGGQAGALGDGGVVDRVDGDADGGLVAVEAAVVGHVGEGVGAVVVGGRRVGGRAVAVERQLAVGRAGHHGRGQRRALHVAVVAEHAGGADRQRRVLVGDVAVVVGDEGGLVRADVHRGDGIRVGAIDDSGEAALV